MVRSATTLFGMAVLAVGCAPDEAMPTTGSSAGEGTHGSSSTTADDASSSESQTTTTVGSGDTGAVSSTGDRGDCNRVVEGDVRVMGASDAAAMEGVYAIERGLLTITRYEGIDLNFLGCLERVDFGISIDRSRKLKSLAGLSRLRSVSPLVVSRNENLESTEGLEALTDAGWIMLLGNPELSELSFSSLKTLDTLFVGDCVLTNQVEDPMPFDLSRLDNPKLTNFDGLASIDQIQHLEVGGQSGLASLAGLHALAGDGRLSTARFTHNPSLPAGEIESVRALMPADERISSCRNLDEPEEDECTICPIE